MKFSSKMKRCGLSPMRKFNGYAADAEARGIKIYHLNIGQPDIHTPQAYYDALKNYSDPVISYAPSQGINPLLDAIRHYYAGIGVMLERKDILITNGGSEALQMTLASILDDGDEILIPEPFYPNYHTSVTLAGAFVKPIPTSPEEGYRFAVREKIEPLINEHTRAILVTNPGNPTGTVLTRDELKLMLDIAKEHNLFILCDEVYREFVYGGEPLVSALQYPGYEENLIIIDSVSKRFSACGARIGILISKNAEFMSEAMKWCQCRLSVSSTDQAAAAALYSVGSDYFAAVREEYKARRDAMVKKLEQIPGVIFARPEGAFYIMAALPVDDADKFQLWLLNEFDDHGETVMFACGEPFYGTPGKGKNEVRMAYVLKKEDLERALDILKIALEKYNNRQ
ncbi:MAG: pyridoxal phosphate-dependent aminotransferase [Oscillospiraceae bacterium]|nr:pyridoxal phosphate-dependent aminotransferase [Oscillospiraceae bacterium]